MKTAGIIGGLGPETTADFYLRVNTLAEARAIPERPPCLIWNVPLPYSVERRLLLEGTGIEAYVPYMVDAAKRLEAAGADFLSVPCNTVHELYDAYAGAVDIPVLHIVDETTRHIGRLGLDRVGVIATGRTVQSELYQSRLFQAGIGYEIPSPPEQTRINEIVDRLVTNIGEVEDYAWFCQYVEDRFKDVGAVVLGCTDLHILVEGAPIAPFVDSMAVLAQATTEMILEERA